jgi:hypothetical protein
LFIIAGLFPAAGYGITGWQRLAFVAVGIPWTVYFRRAYFSSFLHPDWHRNTHWEWYGLISVERPNVPSPAEQMRDGPDGEEYSALMKAKHAENVARGVKINQRYYIKLGREVRAELAQRSNAN